MNVVSKKALIVYDEKSFKDAETCILIEQDKFGWATYQVEFLVESFQFMILVKFLWLSLAKAPKNFYLTAEAA